MTYSKIDLYDGLLQDLKRDFLRSPRAWIVLHLPFLLAYTGIDWLQGFFPENMFGFVLKIVIFVAVLRLIGFLSSGAAIELLQKLERGDTLDFLPRIRDHLRSRLRDAEVANIRTTVLIILGYFALLLPGAFLSILYIFVPVILLGRSVAPTVAEAIEESKEMAGPHFWPIAAVDSILGLSAATVALMQMYFLSKIGNSALSVLTLKLTLLPITFALWMIHNMIFARLYLRISAARIVEATPMAPPTTPIAPSPSIGSTAGTSSI